MRWLNDRVSPQPMFTVNQACFILKNTPGTRAFDRTITFHNLDKGKVIDLVLIPEQTGSVKVELSSSSVVLAKKVSNNRCNSNCNCNAVECVVLCVCVSVINNDNVNYIRCGCYTNRVNANTYEAQPVKVNVFVHVKEKIETNPNLLIQVRGRTRGVSTLCTLMCNFVCCIYLQYLVFSGFTCTRYVLTF